MKSKYMSRKFIIALVGIILAIVGVVFGNNIAVLAGCFIGASFIIGESIIDKASSVHRNIDVTEVRDYDIKVEKSQNGKNEAERD